VLEEADLPLGVSMSISMFELSWTIGLIVVSLDVAGFNVFAKSLIGPHEMVVKEKEASCVHMVLHIDSSSRGN